MKPRARKSLERWPRYGGSNPPGSTAILLLLLTGCSLPMYGTGPIGEAREDAGIVETAPPPTVRLPEAAPPIAEAQADVSDADAPDVSPGNPFGRPANADAFKSCLTTCLAGCCDPSGLCWPGWTDNACGLGRVACSDCTPYGAHCGDAGVCLP